MNIFLSLLNSLLNYPWVNKPFPSCLKPLFQSEAKCDATKMKIIFILMQIKLALTRKTLHLASFWKWELTSSNYKIKIFHFFRVIVLSDIRTAQDYLSFQKFSVSLFRKPCTLRDDLYAGSLKLSTGYVLPIVFHTSEPVIPWLRISENLITQDLSIYNIWAALFLSITDL